MHLWGWMESEKGTQCKGSLFCWEERWESPRIQRASNMFPGNWQLITMAGEQI